MNELLKKPLAHPEDLGKPIPGWPDATSVCMPRWEDNVGYEEGDLRVIDALACGYPRFVYHPFVQDLIAACERRFPANGRCFVAFPSRRVAESCCQYLTDDSSSEPAIHDFGALGIHAVSVNTAHSESVRSYWQHSGDVISPRMAKAALAPEPGWSDGKEIKEVLRHRIADYLDVPVEYVFLYPSGMSAIFNTWRALHDLYPELKSVQFGFPYVDTLRIQQKFGAGYHFLSAGDDESLTLLEAILRTGPIMGVFCEFPMNPLMNSPNLERLADLAEQYQFPIVVDETLGTFVNIQVIPPADIVTTSLTKFFSGAGDVMGGAVVVNPNGRVAETLIGKITAEYEDNLWSEDAVILEKNSRSLSDRMAKINSNAEAVCRFLVDHPAVEKLYYPHYSTRANYDQFRRVGGGYGGVFSVVLKNPSVNAPKFFDALEISKGPSLGTNFSLACPYSILAHYNELDFIEEHGVSRYLIRISVGLEEASDLVARLKAALSAIPLPD